MSDRGFDLGEVRPASDEGHAALLRLSFQRVEALGDVVAELFYGRLFVLDPSLRPLFRGDMKAQGRKLLSALTVVVRHAETFEAIAPVVESLGRRHVAYGVRDEHYDTVRSALIWTLQQGLGDDFTPATAAAWADVYDRVAGAMRAAAHEVAPPSRAPRSVHPRSARAPLSSRAPQSSRAPASQSFST